MKTRWEIIVGDGRKKMVLARYEAAHFRLKDAAEEMKQMHDLVDRREETRFFK